MSPWRRRALPALVLVLVASLAQPAGAASTARATGPCALPDALLEAGLLAEASARYHAAAKAASPEALEGCVARGLARIREVRHARAGRIRVMARRVAPELVAGTVDRLVAAASIGAFGSMPQVVARGIAQRGEEYGFAIARALDAARYPGVADAVVAATVRAHPRAELPSDLRDLPAAARYVTARQRMQAALTLSDAGLDAEAREQVKAAVEADPTIQVPDELASPTRRESFWKRLLGSIGPIVVTAAEIVAVVFAGLLLLLIAVRTPRRFRARMLIEGVQGGSDDATRASTSASLHENYGRLNEDARGRRVRFVDSSAEAFPAMPPTIVETFPQVGVLAELLHMLDALVPTRVRRVRVELRSRHPSRGVGLTIGFGRRHGKAFDEVTLWESDYGAVDPSAEKPDYGTVALAAAAWLTCAAARRTLRRSLPGPLGRKAFTVLGTDDWRSYALFAVAADREAAGKLDDARQLYHRALGRDGSNVGAEFNLIGLDLFADTIDAETLAGVRERLARLRGRLTPTDAHWYRVRYRQAVALLHRDAPAVPDARAAAVDLCATLCDEVRRLARRRRRMLAVVRALVTPGARSECYRGDLARSRRDLLEELRPTVLLLLANALQADGPAGTQPDLVPTIDREELYHRLLTARAAGGVVPDLDAATIVAHVRAEHEPLRPDARYNLACYYVRVGEMRSAELALRTALEQGDGLLRRLVRADTALLPLLEGAGLGRRIGELVAQIESAPRGRGP